MTRDTDGSPVAPRGWARRSLSLHAWLVFVFLYAPIVVLVVFSFSAGSTVGKWGGLSLGWYRDLGHDEDITRAVWTSLGVAAVSTMVSVVLGTMAALSLERFEFRGKRVFDALLYLPVIVPDVTMAVMMLLFFDRAFDVLDAVFGWRTGKGFETIVMSHVAFGISFVSIVVRARLAGMDERLEEAARDLHATRWAAFRTITLPQIAPGIVGGALLALTLSLDDVVVTQFSSGPGSTTLPVYVFGLIRKDVTPLVNAVSVVMLTASMMLVAVSVIVQRSASRGGVRSGSRSQTPSPAVPTRE